VFAGFERPTTGTVSINGVEVQDDPPYNRNTGMVFQGYALFPHKTVAENVGFGLKMEGVPAEERAHQVTDILELVDLPGFHDRYPEQLSGGQQQRVALARALVIEPSVLLLDEPLSNLDLKLREEMRLELKRIQQELEITTIYVTHDQEEALAMSDRILVMDSGRRSQVGTPKSIYNEPANEFVANFIGTANLIDATVTDVHGDTVEVTLDIGSNQTLQFDRDRFSEGVAVDDAITLNVRPEKISFGSATVADGAVSVEGVLATRTFHGKSSRYFVDVEDVELTVETSGQADDIDNGDRVTLLWDTSDCLVIDT
jgi:spermidine/putrescine transport system ATP-binding protein